MHREFGAVESASKCRMRTYAHTRLQTRTHARAHTQAVKQGFRGIDTACQPKHYYEPGVGAALRRLEQASKTNADIKSTCIAHIAIKDADSPPFSHSFPPSFLSGRHQSSRSFHSDQVHPYPGPGKPATSKQSPSPEPSSTTILQPRPFSLLVYLQPTPVEG